MDINELERNVARAQADVESAVACMHVQGFFELPQEERALVQANLATALAHKDFALWLLDEANDINARKGE